MTRFWWVRHGPTHQKSFTGWRDVPADLSDTAKVERLETYLPKIAHVISSDLIRAHATADAITGDRKRLVSRRELRELDFGLWDGQPFDDISRDYPELSRAYWETPGDIKPPEGESWNDLHARLTPIVDELTDLEGDIIVVAHMGVIMTQIERASGVTPYEAMGHKIEPLSVTQIGFERGQWSVTSINHEP